MSGFHYTIIVTKRIHDNDVIAISVGNVLIVISCRLTDKRFLLLYFLQVECLAVVQLQHDFAQQ